MKRPGMLIAFIVLAVVAVASAIYFYSRGAATPPPTPGTQTGEALIGGPFTLTAQDGSRISEQDLQGGYALVMFGYTHCPDICPLGLDTMTRALESLPAATAERVRPVFITIDPARDTPEVLAAYAGSFHPRLLALTGSEAEVEQAVKAYRVYARKADAEAGGQYLMDHSAFTYLMAPDGRYLAHFSHSTTPEEMAGKLATLLDGQSATS